MEAPLWETGGCDNKCVLSEKLDRLAAAFEARGIPVTSNLRPGVTGQELDDLADRLGVDLPPAFRDLYMWRNGHIDPAAPNVLVFRDNTFLSLDEIPDLHAHTLAGYGPYLADLDLEFDLAQCVPIAHFEGSIYGVVCGPHALTDRSLHPVVGIFQGIDMYFYSIETMVDTCIEWVEQPDYEQYGTAPNEHAIWNKHNPGVFPGWEGGEP